MARTLRNENGDTISVDVGDVVTMRSGNRYLMVEVPQGGASGPADWPTGVGANGHDTDFHDVMLDRIKTVTPGTPGSRQLARTASSLGLVSNMPERIASMISAARESASEAASAARGASAPSAAGTGNS